MLLPRFGQPPKCTSVYIGNESTYSTQQYRQAVAKAVVLRGKAEKRYEAAATTARRKAAVAIKAALRKNASS